MKIEFKGTITDIKPERVYGAKQIRVIEIRCAENLDTKYPVIIPFKIKYDPTSYKINPLAAAHTLKIGQFVSFMFEIKGRVNNRNGEDMSYVDLQICSDVTVLRDADLPA